MSNEIKNYNWLTEEEWGKLNFRMRSHISEALRETHDWYGQASIVDTQVEVIMFYMEQGFDIVRGKDRPIKKHPYVNRYDENQYGADD